MNSRGHPATLHAAHPGNFNGLRDAAFSERLREPRVQAIAEQILALPHMNAGDELIAVELAKVTALVECLDAAIARRGIGGQGRGTSLVELRLRASRRSLELAEALAMTPRARTSLMREMAEGSLAAEFTRRRNEMAADA